MFGRQIKYAIKVLRGEPVPDDRIFFTGIRAFIRDAKDIYYELKHKTGKANRSSRD